MYAFTAIAQGISRQLTSDVNIENPYPDPSDGQANVNITCTAVWDTGATSSCVSTNLAQRLNLVSVGKEKVNGVGGVTVQNRHIVNLKFPSGLTFLKVAVTDAELRGFDALIGMDIITQGDLAISNFDGKTVFTFRIPSQEKTDYVQQARKEKAVGPKHGHGKCKKK